MNCFQKNNKYLVTNTIFCKIGPHGCANVCSISMVKYCIPPSYREKAVK